MNISMSTFLTKRELVLLALYRMTAGDTCSRVPRNSLIVESWKLDKKKMGLREYWYDYPDSNTVIVLLTSRRLASEEQKRNSLLDSQKIVRHDDGTYSITHLGIEEAIKLENKYSMTKGQT